MAQFTITRLLDVNKVMETDIGQKIPDFFRYMAQFVEQSVRSLKRGITFRDNVDCDINTVSLKHGLPQIVQVSKSPVTACYAVRATSQTEVITGFNWYYSDSGAFTVVARFAAQADGAVVTVTATDTKTYKVPVYQDPPTTSIPVTLVILF